MIQITHLGFSGKLGAAFTEVIQNHESINVIQKVNSKNFVSERSLLLKSKFILDTTIASCTIDWINWLTKNNYFVPSVIATTGFTKSEFNQIEQYAKKAPVLYSANFSILIHLMHKFLATNQSILKNLNYNAAIVETHHTKKKDSPSGTALYLQSALNLLNPTIESVREGNVIGIHEIALQGNNDSLKLIHQANNRKLFADGIVQAILWLNKKSTGLYTMQDLLL